MSVSPARSLSWRRGVAAGCAAAIVVVSAAGPLAVAAAAQGSSSVLGQAQGSAVAPSPSPGAGASPAPSASPGAGGASGAGADASQVLNPPADFSAPGVSAGRQLIAWAKAGAMVLGTLGLIAGSVIGKLLRQAGNHHAEGVRATVMGISGALVVAGAASTIVTWLMNA